MLVYENVENDKQNGLVVEKEMIKKVRRRGTEVADFMRHRTEVWAVARRRFAIFNRKVGNYILLLTFFTRKSIFIEKKVFLRQGLEHPRSGPPQERSDEEDEREWSAESLFLRNEMKQKPPGK